MEKLYVYTVVREDLKGNRGKRAKKMWAFDDHLKVGGLYAQLGAGFPGLQRVLSVEVRDI